MAKKTAHRFYNGLIAPSELIKCMWILEKAYYSMPSAGLLLREAFHGLRIHMNAAACIYGFSNLLAGWSVMKRLHTLRVPTLVMAGRDGLPVSP